LQLGRLPSRHERAAREGFHDLLGVKPQRAIATDEAAASAANATQVLFTSFRRARLFFVVAVVLMASTPWVLLQRDQ
jgi:hypothetical protein